MASFLSMARIGYLKQIGVGVPVELYERSRPIGRTSIIPKEFAELNSPDFTDSEWWLINYTPSMGMARHSVSDGGIYEFSVHSNTSGFTVMARYDPLARRFTKIKSKYDEHEFVMKSPNSFTADGFIRLLRLPEHDFLTVILEEAKLNWVQRSLIKKYLAEDAK